MSKIYTIGELLIDFLAKNEIDFTAQAGGAPANVAVVVRKLGGKSSFIGSVGNDYFGHMLKNTISNLGVETDYLRVVDYHTMLAFVTIDETGDREFAFYRENTADQHISIKNINFKNDILHFGSVALTSENNIAAHEEAIKIVKENQGIISFDANIRLNLWKDKFKLKSIVDKFLNYSDIVKVSEEELLYLSDKKTIEDGVKYFQKYPIKVLLVTRGSNGSCVYVNDKSYCNPGIKVNAIDTTGAGDAYVGAVLYKLQVKETEINELISLDWQEIIDFATLISATSTTKHGAIASYEFEHIKFK